jgi:hypothetical protein
MPVDAFFHLYDLFHAVGKLDHCLRKPLATVVPGVDDLHERLEHSVVEKIVVGPRRRYFSALALSVLLTIPGGICLSLLIAEPARYWFVQFIGWFVVLLYFRRGGTLVMKKSAIELRCRGTVVSCPWHLFNAQGEVFHLPTGDAVMVPIDSSVVAHVVAFRADQEIACGEQVRTRQLAVNSGAVTLGDLYEVSAIELGDLFLHMGLHFAEAHPELVEPALPPQRRSISIADDGWITLRITALRFGPACSDCGTRTEQQQAVVLRGTLLGDEKILVPLCSNCRDSAEFRYWNSVVAGCLLGFLPFAGVGSIGAWLSDVDFCLMFATPAFIGLGVGGGLGHLVGLHRSAPVRFKRFSEQDGTVSVYFRNHSRGVAWAQEIEQASRVE